MIAPIITATHDAGTIATFATFAAVALLMYALIDAAATQIKTRLRRRAIAKRLADLMQEEEANATRDALNLIGQVSRSYTTIAEEPATMINATELVPAETATIGEIADAMIDPVTFDNLPLDSAARCHRHDERDAVVIDYRQRPICFACAVDMTCESAEELLASATGSHIASARDYATRQDADSRPAYL